MEMESTILVIQFLFSLFFFLIFFIIWMVVVVITAGVIFAQHESVIDLRWVQGERVRAK